LKIAESLLPWELVNIAGAEGVRGIIGIMFEVVLNIAGAEGVRGISGVTFEVVFDGVSTKEGGSCVSARM